MRMPTFKPHPQVYIYESNWQKLILTRELEWPNGGDVMRACAVRGLSWPRPSTFNLLHGSKLNLIMMVGARFVLFELLLALSCCCRHVEPSSVFTRPSSQTTVELLLCKELSSTVSLYDSTLITVMANLSLCENTNKINATVSQSIAVNIIC